MEGLETLIPLLERSPDAAAIILLLFLLKKVFDVCSTLVAFGERIATLEGKFDASLRATSTVTDRRP